MADTNTVFTPFTADDIVTGVPNRITDAMWSNNVGILTHMCTSSAAHPLSLTGSQAAASLQVSKYYYDVYGYNTTGSSQVEFSIAYGHVSGSGSDLSDREMPTKAIYGQYRNLLLDNARGRFALLVSTSYYLNDFIAIDVKRANLRQKFDAGNWQLNITGIAGSKVTHLIDASNDANDVNVTNIGRVVSVVSGTISTGPDTVHTKEYGLFYPDYGIIILSPLLISQSSTFKYGLYIDNYADNAGQFFARISESAYFAARSEEDISSTHYFVRAKNKSYNYSTNPSFYSASDGTIIYSDFATNPKVFITTIGLYNTSNELLAVGKLSQAVQKGFDKEALFKVRLDF